MFAEFVVLRFHHACQRAHQHTAFTGEIGINFFLECGWEEIACANRNAQRDRAFVCSTCCILMNGEAGVDTGAIEEVGAWPLLSASNAVP